MSWINKEPNITLEGIFRTLHLKLQNDALRAFASSPRQKAIIAAREKLERIAQYARKAAQ